MKMLYLVLITLQTALLWPQDSAIITDRSKLMPINSVINSRLDGFAMDTVIYNGNLDLLDPPYVTDIQLGTLSKEELRILRNSIYAKYGYVFKSEDLIQYFQKFPWYTQGETNVEAKISSVERGLLNRISRFENRASASKQIARADIIGIWKEFTGGADQEGTKVILDGDGKFTYTFPQWYIHRTTTLSGNWKYSGSVLTLEVKEQDLLLGGHYVEEIWGDDIKDATKATINYEKGFLVQIPVERSEGIPELPNNSDITWATIGSILSFKD